MAGLNTALHRCACSVSSAFTEKGWRVTGIPITTTRGSWALGLTRSRGYKRVISLFFLPIVVFSRKKRRVDPAHSCMDGFPGRLGGGGKRHRRAGHNKRPTSDRFTYYARWAKPRLMHFRRPWNLRSVILYARCTRSSDPFILQPRIHLLNDRRRRKGGRVFVSFHLLYPRSNVSLNLRSIT